MPARKPTALLKAKGSYEPCKHKNRIDDKLPEMKNEYFEKVFVPTDKQLTTKEAIEFYQKLILVLNSWSVLKEVDVERALELAFVYEQLLKAKEQLIHLPITDENYERYWMLYNRIAENFTKNSAKFGITPIDRAKLTAIESEAIKNDSIASQLYERGKITK